jgi:hypothetical protein
MGWHNDESMIPGEDEAETACRPADESSSAVEISRNMLFTLIIAVNDPMG